MYLSILFFKVLINLSAITDFPLSLEYICISLFSKNDFIDPLYNSLPFSIHILFGVRYDSSKIFRKTLVVVIPVLSFKGTTHAYLL